MKSVNQLLVFIFVVQCLQTVKSKPLFKGLSFKKNYEVEISAIPFKHISFIKEKWFPFKMIGVKHDIEKREVDHKTDNLYKVNEVTFDAEESGGFPGLLTNVKHNLDLNTEGEIINNPAPVVENVEVVPIIDPKSIVGGSIATSSIIPMNPSIVIAPSIQTSGSIVQPPAVVPLNPKVVVTSVPTETVVEPAPVPPPPTEGTIPIQPMHTHVDIVPSINPEVPVSKMHTDISSAVPLNTLVEAPAQDLDLAVPVEVVKVETPEAEVPKVVEEIKVEEPIVKPPPAVTPVVKVPIVPPVVEPPIIPVVAIPIPEVPAKTGPAGVLMRGTRFVLYFGSVMLQMLSQMLAGSPPNLSQLAQSVTLT